MIKKGFTLLELVIVVVVVGLLLSVVIGMFSAKETAKTATIQQQILQIKKSVDDYMRANGLAMYNALGNNNTFKPKLEQFIGTKLPKNPYSRDYQVFGDTNGLTIRTDTGSNETCSPVAKRLKNSASNVTCNGGQLSVTWSD